MESEGECRGGSRDHWLVPGVSRSETSRSDGNKCSP